MPIVRRPGTHIHYEFRGEAGGRPVVLLQGLGLSSRYWFDVPERLQPRRVCLIDNRGTGKSGRPRPWSASTWNMVTMADDVASVLDDAGIERAIVAGISMGGMIAQNFALRHPQRVDGLLLLATSPGAFVATLPRPVALYRLLSLPFGGRRATKNLARLLLPKEKWGSAGEIFREWPNAMRDAPTDARTFVAHLFAASTHFAAPRLGEIACPVIIAAGREDILVPSSNSEAIAKRIPHAELQLLDGVGHAVFAEDRDLVVRLIAKLEERIGVGG